MLPGGRFSGANIEVSPTPVLSNRGRGGVDRVDVEACPNADVEACPNADVAVSATTASTRLAVRARVRCVIRAKVERRLNRRNAGWGRRVQSDHRRKQAPSPTAASGRPDRVL